MLAWGEAHRRDLPWRATRDPWAILVSEVMLQQTQAERVVPHYRRFLEAFPDPAACAEAGPAAAVRAWAGLGYNRRALALQRAAAIVVAEHGGRVPSDQAALLALPGVGPYTARAVRVFAFEHNVGVVDTNVGRVLARAVAGRPLAAAEAQTLADRLVPAGRSWAFNQAMFDLGAGPCRSAAPDCGTCPLRALCRWCRTARRSPDPARRSFATARPSGPFTGSDRQGRGRLVAALRRGPLRPGEVAAASGWPDDPTRAERVMDDLVAEGFATRGSRGAYRLAE